MFEIQPVQSREQVEEVRKLFIEYAEWLGFDLSFQDFDIEIDQLPWNYAPPEGQLFIALFSDEPIGCIGVRRFDESICEMKRLYVRPGFRGQGYGRELAERAITEARDAGYRLMRLDTVPWMTEALALYESLGFRDIQPYRENPVKGARFLELELKRASPDV